MVIDFEAGHDAVQNANDCQDICLAFTYPFGAIWVLADGRRPPLGETRGMRQRGTIFQRGNTWTAVYLNPKVRNAAGKKKPIWKAFKTKEAAEAFLDIQLGAIRVNRHVPPTQATWGEIFAKFDAEFIDYKVKINAMSPATASAYKSILNKHLLPFFGEAQVMDMTPAMMRRWGQGLSELLVGGNPEKQIPPAPMGAKTITNIINLMSTVCRWAKVNEFTTTNWVMDADVERPQKAVGGLEEEDIKFLDRDEVDRCFDYLRDPAGNTTAKAMIVLGLLAGLRRGEIAALQWGCIEWDLFKLKIVQSISAGILGPPKTAASRAKIDIPATALRVLQEHKTAMELAGKSTARLAYVLQRDPRKASLRNKSHAASQLPEGVFHPDELNDFWDEHIKGPLQLKESSTPHAMRHSYASILIKDHREDLPYVQRQMRHASITITLDTYTHLFDNEPGDRMKKLDARASLKVVDFRTGTR